MDRRVGDPGCLERRDEGLGCRDLIERLYEKHHRSRFRAPDEVDVRVLTDGRDGGFRQGKRYNNMGLSSLYFVGLMRTSAGPSERTIEGIPKHSIA